MYVLIIYSLRYEKTVRLAFKFCPTKIIHLNCSKVHLIKAISNTKKELHWEGHGANQMFKFSGSNAFAFIEDLENQINSVVFSHNCYS